MMLPLRTVNKLHAIKCVELELETSHSNINTDTNKNSNDNNTKILVVRRLPIQVVFIVSTTELGLTIFKAPRRQRIEVVTGADPI